MGDEREKLEGKSCTTKFGELHSDTIFNILSQVVFSIFVLIRYSFPQTIMLTTFKCLVCCLAYGKNIFNAAPKRQCPVEAS